MNDTPVAGHASSRGHCCTYLFKNVDEAHEYFKNLIGNSSGTLYFHVVTFKQSYFANSIEGLDKIKIMIKEGQK